MRVLVLGNGAREHAITWKFSKSKRIAGLFIAPGNAGTDEIGENLPNVDPTKEKEVIHACRKHGINMVFVGPELPLSLGLIDRLTEEGIAAIGPHKSAAQLEYSKAFAKNFMVRNGIPTAAYKTFSTYKEFERYVSTHAGKLVVKKSGLAAGKGVLESDKKSELLTFGKKNLSSDEIVVEEFLQGYEISLFCLTDGKNVISLPACADYKKAGEKNTGPNTGGMGAICPVPWLEPDILGRIETEIVKPTFRGLEKEALQYKGVLYFGLIITAKGPRVLEFNVRLGDPEAQVLLPLIKSDFGNLCDAILHEKLHDFPINISDQSCLGVVVASAGYPNSYKKNVVVTSLPDLPENDALTFHAATHRNNANKILTGGGRCFTVVSKANELLEARAKAYSAVKQVRFNGCWYRSDIGAGLFEESQ